MMKIAKNRHYMKYLYKFFLEKFLMKVVVHNILDFLYII